MRHKITLIPGDGTGPEIAEATKRCIEATGLDVEWDIQNAGADVMEKTGEVLPQDVIESIRKNKVAIKGPITTPVGTGFRSVNVAMRKELDLYACVRPCKLYEGVRSRYENVDLVVIRENTEDLYAGIEFKKGEMNTESIISEIERLSKKSIRKDSGISIKPISETGSKRIVRFAFEYALHNKRKKVTAVHKANIMKHTDGLFLECAREVAKEYEGKVEFEDRIVDNMCMQLVQKPELYDCMVLPNLYGDIISDLCAGLVGGLGVAPGGNIGECAALFEPTHGSAPKYKNANKVNPVAMILSGVMMLHYLKEDKKADILESAVAKVIREGKYVTYDLKANRNDPSAAGTAEMADAIIARIKKIK
ncbi:MAG: isocitrate/isopropylmalate dehydrogenase family protein [Candidatus Omnitrophica bacterium]|nr:isocitrate/isopropylmalate dehydrogenase family protein [Candidatus Omnitrophota bacterium]MBU4487561.1 isocitrate/isopropylmalate dehydrogenase family protein [Candidatus Omnitrophota bacterium]MCG2705801.1 isocitrate/isopropylmalate dehydrogenase family protein [Candidatus Omnitrophota bacterium]